MTGNAALRVATVAAVLALSATLAGCANTRTGNDSTSKGVVTAPPASDAASTATPTETPGPQLSGIIAVQGATTSFGPATLDVLTIDPSSGSSTTYATFQSATDGSGPEVSTDLVRNEGGPTPDVVAAMFSHDFTRVAATITDPTTNLINAGWIDSSGQFTNVTGSLYQQGQFADVPGYRDPIFGPGDAFYVSQYTGSSGDTGLAKLYTAAPGSTQPTLVNTPAADYTPYWFWVSPNGTITPQSPGGYHYEENVTPGIGSVRAESWVDAGTWLGVDSNGLQVWADSTVLPRDQINVMDWGSDGRAVTPQVNGFTVRSPVISPDKQTVAFLAKTADGTHLYTVPIMGGQPQMVNTTGVDDTTVLAAWR